MIWNAGRSALCQDGPGDHQFLAPDWRLTIVSSQDCSREKTPIEWITGDVEAFLRGPCRLFLPRVSVWWPVGHHLCQCLNWLVCHNLADQPNYDRSAIICGHHCDNKGHMHTVLHVVTFVLFACSFLFSNSYCSSFPAGLLILLHTTHSFDFWSWRCTQKGRHDQMMQVSFVSQPPLAPHSESTAPTLRSHKPRPTSKVDLYSDALQSTYNVL